MSLAMQLNGSETIGRGIDGAGLNPLNEVFWQVLQLLQYLSTSLKIDGQKNLHNGIALLYPCIDVLQWGYLQRNLPALLR